MPGHQVYGTKCIGRLTHSEISDYITTTQVEIFIVMLDIRGIFDTFNKMLGFRLQNLYALTYCFFYNPACG